MLSCACQGKDARPMRGQRALALSLISAAALLLLNGLRQVDNETSARQRLAAAEQQNLQLKRQLHRLKSERLQPEQASPHTTTIGAAPDTREAHVMAVVGITTPPYNRAARDLLRETWMALPNVVVGLTRRPAAPASGVRAFFVIGAMDEQGRRHAPAVQAGIVEEQRSHGDVVLLPGARETQTPGEKMFTFFETSFHIL